MSEDLGSLLHRKVSGSGALKSWVSLCFITCATLSCDDVTMIPVGLSQGLLRGQGGSVTRELFCALNFMQIAAMPEVTR